MLKRLCFLLLLSCVRFTYATSALIISDVHFNPYAQCGKLPFYCASLKGLMHTPIESWQFADSSPSAYLADTNAYLLNHGLAALKTQLAQTNVPDIFVTGDLLAHNFVARFRYYNYAVKSSELANFAANSLLYVLLQIHRAFPQSNIYLTLGNNDSDTGDYQQPTQEFLLQVAKSAANYLPLAQRESFIQQFSQAGYYTIPLNQRIQVISINSNLLSSKAQDNLTAANVQLNWLGKQFMQLAAQHKRAIILQHIPFGIDAYLTLKKKFTSPFFVAELQAKYLAAIHTYNDKSNSNSVLANIYAGHSHSDYLQLVDNSVPVVGTLALNRLFGNNAGVKLLHYNESTANLEQFTTYTLNYTNNKPQWLELYSFPKSFATKKTLGDFIRSFPSRVNDPIARIYQQNYDGNSINYPQPIHQDINWPKYYCFMNNLTVVDYNQCDLAAKDR